MKTIKHGFHTLEMYDSINETPIKRGIECNKNIMIDEGIGASPQAAQERINMIIAKGKAGEYEDMWRELENLSINIHLASNSESPLANAFVCRIKTINGVPNDDLSPEGIKKTIDKLSELKFTWKHVFEFIEHVKKNGRKNLITTSRTEKRTVMN